MTMRFEKPSPRMVALFEELVAGRPLQRRSMFGMPCAFAGEHMCTGLFADQLFVRLPDAYREALAAEGGRPFEPFPGRVMREYAVFPEAMLADLAAVRIWLDRSVAYAASLPPKKMRGARTAPRRRAAARRGSKARRPEARGPKPPAKAKAARRKRR